MVSSFSFRVCKIMATFCLLVVFTPLQTIHVLGGRGYGSESCFDALRKAVILQLFSLGENVEISNQTERLDIASDVFLLIITPYPTAGV